MFFNSNSRFTKSLTFFYLPFAIFNDLSFIFEPILITYILYISIAWGEITTILSAFLLVSSYISINILIEQTIKVKDKIILLLLAPSMYVCFYILSFVEYIALLKSLVNINKLKKSIENNICSWQHVERAKS
jgi:poly-beta-1,6-N-acetyl-D-glucosamine synthase